MKKLLLTLSLLLWPAIGSAQEINYADNYDYSTPAPTEMQQTYTIHTMPEGHRCVSEGLRYQCFTLEEFVSLIRMDNDLFYARLQVNNLTERLTRANRIAEQLTLAFDGYEAQIAQLQAERERLFAQWTSENRRRLDLENRPDTGSWVAWTIAAVEAVILAGMVVGLAVN